MKKVSIFTGCQCIDNPGEGGWCAILKSGEYEKILSGSGRETTSQRMHLTAAIEGLLALKETCYVTIFCRAEYVKGVIIDRWKIRKNRDIVARLYKSEYNHEVNIILNATGPETIYMAACSQRAREEAYRIS